MHSGEVLFNAGDAADSGFVDPGRLVQRSPRSESGRRPQPSRSDAGTLLGELALLTETKRPVTATALEPSTVLRIPRACS